jgi:integrase
MATTLLGLFRRQYRPSGDGVEIGPPCIGVRGGNPRFSTHVLRHTSLTTALDATYNLRAVMAFARHVKPDVTAGYTRTTSEQLRRVSDALKF